MKYVITGSLGHISKPLVQKLVAAGNDVTVITSSQDRVPGIEALGAKSLVGSVTDTTFLRTAFEKADAAYTMVPPFFGAPDWKKHIAVVGKNYADALKGSAVRYVVNLSSIGADNSEGCGPVSGLYAVENALDGLEDVNVLHLRPGYFYNNFFSHISLISNLGFVGGNYGENARMVLVDTSDIADTAAEALLRLSFTGKSVKYVSSDDKTTDEIASVLGTAIGKPGLKWVNFSDEQTLDGMLNAGLPKEVADNYTEMGAAIRNGKLFNDYYATHQVPVGKTKLDDFAAVFATAWAETEKSL
jgi:uncharacterized protein YbjT (DUF2867 family)